MKKVYYPLAFIISSLFLPIGCEQSDPPIAKRPIKDSGDIVFSGYGWNIKSSTTPVGPGPNYFSKSDSMIWVDNNGYLHLRIAKIGNIWNSTELVCTENMGYGEYKFILGSNVADINEKIVVGLFTWDNNTFMTDGNSEVDIEFSKWLKPNDTTTLTYSVQPVIFENPIPYSERSFKPLIARNSLRGSSTHLFQWLADGISWRSYSGENTNSSNEICSWFFDKNNTPRNKIEGGISSNPIVIPAPGNTTNARINVWLLNGQGPSDNKPFELIIKSFEYIPSF